MSKMHTVTACIPNQMSLLSLCVFLIIFYTALLETDLWTSVLASMTGDSQQTCRLVSEIEPNITRNCPAVRHMPCSGIAGFTVDYTEQ